MFFQWLLVFLAVAAIVVLFRADASTKKKKTSYFEAVQKQAAKGEREITIAEFDQHDGFYAKLNG